MPREPETPASVRAAAEEIGRKAFEAATAEPPTPGHPALVGIPETKEGIKMKTQPKQCFPHDDSDYLTPFLKQSPRDRGTAHSGHVNPCGSPWRSP